ncbi:MAG: DUF512 domain-containing protein, partial [Oscillospiraceae bacterium]|nr:DUF512 domain-containing protein [Oscillospiraceae bacterium]
CFVDQMPPDMRETLYFKDDDSRLSFLFGNYTTLTNMPERDVQRIIKMHISPINVSVHTTNPKLRVAMMRNPNAGTSLEILKRFAEAGIKLNTQLVLCPGINDGDELRRSLADLSELYPSVQSIAVVPVGITSYREKLDEIKPYNKDTAKAVIDIVDEFSNNFLQKNGVRLAYSADEFYIKAEQPIPEYDYYEEFNQLENGVGLMALLKDEFETALDDIEKSSKTRHISIATGVDAEPFISKLVDDLCKKWHNLTCNVYAIKNNFFGETITVAGLVTATDLISQLKGKFLGDELLIPSVMLRHEKDKFLDDKTIADVENALGIKVRTVDNDGYELLSAITGE